LQDIKKELRFAGKGHNEILEIHNSINHARTASDSVDFHVPENGGTCQKRFTLCYCDEMSIPGDDDVQYSSDDTPEQQTPQHDNPVDEKEEQLKEKSSSYVLEARNLSRNVNSAHLKEIFGSYGTVIDAECIELNHITLGVGLVHFQDEKGMNNAMKYLDGV
jgi:hypothetical protein